MIQIRLANYDDISDVREVAIQSYEATFAAFNTRENMDAFYSESYALKVMQREFYEPHSYMFVATDGDSILGFVRLRKNDEANDKLGDNTVELQRLYIHPQHQGRNIGKQLMEAALQQANELKVEYIWLGVWERNFKAQKFYSHWGFERFGEHVFQMGDDPQIDWLLKRKL